MTANSYYGQPVIKSPVWTWEIPTYFLTGGIAGASSVLAVGARINGDDRLAEGARAVAAATAAVSPALLVSDLGKPERFHHMLRVFRPSSPMNIGSWMLMVYAPAAIGAWFLGRRSGWSHIQKLAELVAAVLGPGISTYTAVLISDTAVPVWHVARRELPFVFAGSSLAGAGALAMLTNSSSGRSEKALAIVGTVAQLAASQEMKSSLEGLALNYQRDKAGLLDKAAQALSWSGIAVTALAKKRTVIVLGSVLLLGGAVCERWSIFKAGSQSASDPAQTVQPQREGMRLRGGQSSD